MSLYDRRGRMSLVNRRRRDRRVYSRVDDGALSRAVGNLTSAAGNSNFLSAVDSARLLGDRGDRSGHLGWLRLGEADDRRIGGRQGRVRHVRGRLLVSARSNDAGSRAVCRVDCGADGHCCVLWWQDHGLSAVGNWVRRGSGWNGLVGRVWLWLGNASWVYWLVAGRFFGRFRWLRLWSTSWLHRLIAGGHLRLGRDAARGSASGGRIDGVSVDHGAGRRRDGVSVNHRCSLRGGLCGLA